MDLGAGWAAVHGVAKSRTRLNNFTFTACIFFFFDAEAETPILWPLDEKSQLWKRP